MTENTTQKKNKREPWTDPEYCASLGIPASVWYFRKNNKRLSIIAKLKEQGRLNDELEIMIGLLSLDELISIKLEYSVKNAFTGNGRFYGFSMMKMWPMMMRALLLRFALIVFPTRTEARGFLDLKTTEMDDYVAGFGFLPAELKWTKKDHKKYWLKKPTLRTKTE